MGASDLARLLRPDLENRHELESTRVMVQKWIGADGEGPLGLGMSRESAERVVAALHRKGIRVELADLAVPASRDSVRDIEIQELRRTIRQLELLLASLEAAAPEEG